MTQHIPPDAEDNFLRGYHDIPDAPALRAMSYIKLASLLESCEKDSARFHVLEAEKRRRDNVSLATKVEVVVAHVDPDNDKKPSPDHWYKKPLPVIFLAVAAGCIILGIRYVLIHHFGVPF